MVDGGWRTYIFLDRLIALPTDHNEYTHGVNRVNLGLSWEAEVLRLLKTSQNGFTLLPSRKNNVRGHIASTDALRFRAAVYIIIKRHSFPQ